MSKCDRGGTIYKRHKYKNGQCKRCGVSQAEQLATLAVRREARKAAKTANSLAQSNPQIFA